MVRNPVAGLLLTFGAALLVGSPAAKASSTFIDGQFTESNPSGPSYHDPGVCDFITGPRTDLAAGTFLMTVGDQHSPDTAELRLTGSYSASQTDAAADQMFRLVPDRAQAARWFERVLQHQTRDRWAEFTLDDLDAIAVQVPHQRLLCHVRLTGRLTSHVDGALKQTDVSVAFAREGQYFPGNTAVTRRQAAAIGVAAAAAKLADPCPTDLLAPLGLNPVPARCNPSSCLVDFKNYKWWTAFNYRGDGSYFPGGGYFYNGGLHTPFAPKNVFVDGEGLHLKIAKQDLGGGAVPAGAEAVLMFNPDNSAANLGYGDYLVAAKLKTASSWSKLDPNAALGVFTFERVGKGSDNGTSNPFREIDLAEISRWGWDGAGPCPLDDKRLCTGNAQFALQIHDRLPHNVHRYTIRDGTTVVTLVMKWHGAGKPVTFEQYDGGFSFKTLPAAPTTTWTSGPDQDQFIPATACQRFHVNLWMGNYIGNPPGAHPPPKLDQEAVITNFEFEAFP